MFFWMLVNVVLQEILMCIFMYIYIMISCIWHHFIAFTLTSEYFLWQHCNTYATMILAITAQVKELTGRKWRGFRCVTSECSAKKNRSYSGYKGAGICQQKMILFIHSWIFWDTRWHTDWNSSVCMWVIYAKNSGVWKILHSIVLFFTQQFYQPIRTHTHTYNII